jgi:5-methylcytosine-specific restriction endonuclease McrA
MGKVKDLTGQRFGRWRVIKEAGRNKQRHVMWLCRCDCGNEKNVVGSSLTNGNSTSCGCLQKERVSEAQVKDLTGIRFFRLLGVEQRGRNKHGAVLWLCKCDCGNAVIVLSSNLIRGLTKSCGCYFREQISGENNYGWKGGVTLLNEKVRKCLLYRKWRTSVFKRDSYSCQICNQIGGILRVHHKKSFSLIMENVSSLEEALSCMELWDMNNGITYCYKCHEEEHARLKGLDNQFECSIIQEQK